MRATYVRVLLPAIAHNTRLLCSLIGQSGLMAVVKADGYGHGIYEVARTALSSGASMLGVALAEEGLKLREKRIRQDILVLGTPVRDVSDVIVEQGLIQTVYAPRHIEDLQHSAERLGKPARVHVKVETGMNRIGVKGRDALDELLNAIAMHKAVRLEGLFTHFADSENLDQGYMDQQLRTLLDTRGYLAGKGQNSLTYHAANSGAVLSYPDSHLDLVRPGIALYGYSPGCSVPNGLALRPALEWRSRIVHIKDVLPGETISYGRTYTVRSPSRVATLPFGYADGFARSLSNKGAVLIHGQRAPVVGRVCMDQTMADVSAIPQAKIGDEVVLLGRQMGEAIWADEMADLTGTISYEVLCDIGARVPRGYDVGG